MKTLFNSQDVARHLEVTPPTVSQWLKSDPSVPPAQYQTAKGAPLWDSLDEWEAHYAEKLEARITALQAKAEALKA